jgi:hypothetical protein
LLSFVACTSAAFTADLIGQAGTIDGDTLEIHGTVVRSTSSSDVRPSKLGGKTSISGAYGTSASNAGRK